MAQGAIYKLNCQIAYIHPINNHGLVRTFNFDITLLSESPINRCFIVGFIKVYVINNHKESIEPKQRLLLTAADLGNNSVKGVQGN